MVFRFTPRHKSAAIADFMILRVRAGDPMSRRRRRAAARAAWGAVQRRDGESWTDFWKAVLLERQYALKS